MRISTSTSGLLLFAMILLASGVSRPQTASRQPPSSQLQAVAQEISTGRLDQAEKELQTILHSTPGEYRALDLLGVIRVLQRQETKAEELFTQVVQKKPDFAPGHAHLGLLNMQMGRTQEAIRELQEAVRLDPTRKDAVGALVNILQGQAQSASESGDWNNALGLLREARKYAPDNPDIQYEFGLTALRLSLLEDSIEAFQQVLQLRKHDALALYNLGRAFMELSKFDEARQQFAEYVRVRPDDPAGYCALGMTLAALERTHEAREQFERSIALAPTQSESYYRLGLLDLESKDYEAASQNLRHALASSPKNAGVLTALGKVEFEQKHYPEAALLLQQAMADDESLREAHYYLGLTFARLGRKQESTEQLEIASRLEHEEAQHRRTLLRIAEPAAVGSQMLPAAK